VSKIGHEATDCIAYTGSKQGQYPDWWRGPWNIHLPKTQCSKDNSIPSKSHPAYAWLYAPRANHSHTADISHVNASNITQTATDSSLNRSTTTYIHSDDDLSQANSALAPNNLHVWNTQLNNTVTHATLPILNPSLRRDNSCHHDSGVN
jgi:hypothetical protein